MLFAIAFRWTAVTGGESGLGGVVRPVVLGIDLGQPVASTTGSSRRSACWSSGAVALPSLADRPRAGRDPRERAARALHRLSDRTATSCSPSRSRPASRRSPACSRCSTTASPRPSRSRHRFSGELLAMVVIGGMRTFLGPALGALFFILFREFLSIWTPNWLLFFGLLFVGFIVFSPTGLVGVAERVLRPFRPQAASRPPRWRAGGDRAEPLPAALRPAGRATARCWSRARLAKHFGGIRAVAGRRHRRAGPHAARADRPERRRQDHGVQSVSGMFRARRRHGRRWPARPIAGPRAARTSRAPASAARSRSPTCSRRCRSRRTCASPCRRAHASRFAWWRDARAIADVNAETAEVHALPRAHRHRARRGRRALLWRPAPARHGARARDRAAHPAARRAARRARGGRARARRRAGEAHLGRIPCCWSSTTSTACSRSPTSSR